ncbi:hypothetical protein [Paracoccus litorisediminis]|uniref:Uncharacterized protein n=1 Tax=Paracoccus litorisediminis TaxID=2006130 RepID=A0A844HPE9_9RHOB|nr:hypothetical protein [Paracoccus litorisediminis]MTH60025.1 hypothetical protein [Paracoccus litorisediminis]
MRIKMGKVVHVIGEPADYRKAMAMALFAGKVFLPIGGGECSISAPIAPPLGLEKQFSTARDGDILSLFSRVMRVRRYTCFAVTNPKIVL